VSKTIDEPTPVGRLDTTRPGSAPPTTFRADATTEKPWPPVGDEEEIERLHYQLDALLPRHLPRAIQFIGSRPGEGTSTIAREFALVSATRFGQRVLLLEFDQHGDGAERAGQTPARVGDTTLYVSPLSSEFTAATHSSDVRSAEAAWEGLRQAWDLIVLDSPPATLSPESLAMVSRVDGVVLVLEAETTRWPVAARTKESIVRSGGHVLGVVLNKRRHYIPAFIYNWL
jgi:protein-tyrosine kinase